MLFKTSSNQKNTWSTFSRKYCVESWSWNLFLARYVLCIPGSNHNCLAEVASSWVSTLSVIFSKRAFDSCPSWESQPCPNLSTCKANTLQESITLLWMVWTYLARSSGGNFLPYILIICLKSVDLPDSPAPRRSNLCTFLLFLASISKSFAIFLSWFFACIWSMDRTCDERVHPMLCVKDCLKYDPRGLDWKFWNRPKSRIKVSISRSFLFNDHFAKSKAFCHMELLVLATPSFSASSSSVPVNHVAVNLI